MHPNDGLGYHALEVEPLESSGVPMPADGRSGREHQRPVQLSHM